MEYSQSNSKQNQIKSLFENTGFGYLLNHYELLIDFATDDSLPLNIREESRYGILELAEIKTESVIEAERLNAKELHLGLLKILQ